MGGETAIFGIRSSIGLVIDLDNVDLSNVTMAYEVDSPSPSAVWMKVSEVYFSERRSGVKRDSPPGFLCHNG